MTWRLGLLILLGVAIVVVVVVYRKNVFEGFQTTSTVTRRAILEPTVFVVNQSYLTNRFPEIRVVQGVMNTSTIPTGLTGLTGEISKENAYTLCARLGATMARIDDVRKEKRKGTTWPENGWVDDLDKPIQMTAVGDGYERLQRNNKDFDSGQQNVTTAYAICIGPNPASGATLPSGWSVIPSTVAELPALEKENAGDTATTMTIFDPTAAYIQADIAQMEYPILMTEIYKQDKCRPRPSDPTADAVIKQITQYFWWVQNYSDFNSSMYTWYSWIYRRRYRDLPNIEAGYWSDYLSRIGTMSRSISERFKAHPISFIMKDYESIKTTEFIESVNSAQYVESTTANDRGSSFPAFAQCDTNRPGSIIKTQKIVFSEMPDGYPDPGFFCIPANDDLTSPDTVFQTNKDGIGPGRGMNAGHIDIGKESDASCKWKNNV